MLHVTRGSICYGGWFVPSRVFATKHCAFRVLVSRAKTTPVTVSRVFMLVLRGEKAKCQTLENNVCRIFYLSLCQCVNANTCKIEGCKHHTEWLTSETTTHFSYGRVFVFRLAERKSVTLHLHIAEKQYVGFPLWLRYIVPLVLKALTVWQHDNLSTVQKFIEFFWF